MCYREVNLSSVLFYAVSLAMMLQSSKLYKEKRVLFFICEKEKNKYDVYSNAPIYNNTFIAMVKQHYHISKLNIKWISNPLDIE